MHTRQYPMLKLLFTDRNIHACPGICLWLLWLMLSLPGTALAKAAAVQLDDTQQTAIQLAPYYQLFVDQHGHVTIDDILLADSPIPFTDLPHGDASLGFHPQAYWFKVDVANHSDHDLKRFLEFKYPLLDHISVYVVDARSNRILADYHSGDTLPFDSRLYHYSNILFPLTLPARSVSTLYFRIQSRGSLITDTTLWPTSLFPVHARMQMFFITLYFGLLIGLLCYNFLLFLAIREKSYLLYVLFTFFMLMAIGSLHGLWFELLWPASPQWHNLSIPIFFSLAALFAILFSQTLLETRARAPVFHTLFNILAGCFIALLFMIYFAPQRPIAQILTALAVLLTVTAFAAGLYLTIKQFSLARTYLLAWLALFISTLVLAGKNFGWLPDTLITRYSLMLGNALEMVLLSFALAQRINILKQSTQQSRQETLQVENTLIEVLKNREQELVERVKKRTQDLEKANRILLTQKGELKKLAHFDALTGLANRTLINEQLGLLLARCQREHKRLAVLFLDLDGFKSVNDRYGHKIGDALLRIVAQRLQETLRNSDLIGRLGGDEFIVVIQATQDNFAPCNVADKIKQALSRPAVIQDHTIRIGVSIGIAVYPDDGGDVDALLSVSDSAMYRDKKQRKHI